MAHAKGRTQFAIPPGEARSRTVEREVLQASAHRQICILRLPQVLRVTGLGKTKIYELQAEGRFPMRVQITAHSVGWVEADVQAWLASRVVDSTPIHPDADRKTRPALSSIDWPLGR